jgi:hypothetical protein
MNCGAEITWETFEWHHVRLRGMGGGFRDDSVSNGLALCFKCHHQKHN